MQNTDEFWENDSSPPIIEHGTEYDSTTGNRKWFLEPGDNELTQREKAMYIIMLNYHAWMSV